MALATDQAPELPPATPCEQVRKEVAKYDWDVDIMMAIAHAESGCNPTNHNLTSSETHRDQNGNVICVGSYGALQVGCLHYNGEDRNDIAANIRIAYQVYKRQGLSAWTQFTNGEYRRHL